MTESFPLRVLFIITRSDVMGGASVHLLDLASGLQAKNYDVHILAGGTGILNDFAEQRHLSISSIPSLVRDINLYRDFKAFFELKRAIKNFKPDLVHLHSSKAGLLGRLACRSLSIPCVFTAHGWAFTEGVSALRRRFYLALERFASPLANKIIAVSEYDKSLAIKNNVVTESQVVLVHNGVSDRASQVGLAVHTDKADVRIIMVARFEQPKDQIRLLKVLSRLQSLPWVLEFVGDGPGLAKAQSLCAQLGVISKVRFSGACSDVPNRLVGADIFVLLSHWEGLPLTILEAMCVGLPVIASDVGGVKETINHDSGFLVSGASDDDLIEALQKLILSAELRTQMGSASRALYEKCFTVGRMIEQTESIYRQVVVK